jgi:hypothetical protein
MFAICELFTAIVRMGRASGPTLASAVRAVSAQGLGELLLAELTAIESAVLGEVDRWRFS